MDLKNLTSSSIRNVIVNEQMTASEVLDKFIIKIKQSAEKNNTFISTRLEEAKSEATKIDRKLAEGNSLGVLAGVPIAIKDNIVIRNERTTCASKMLSNYKSPYNATVIDKIIQADGLIVGKTNMDEFAMGSTNRTSFYGPVRNPVYPGKVPGGRSGGSAAAVAAGEVMLALGTDTGGSVRQPAAFCGVVGYKPSYGMISRYGVVSMANTFDTVGILSRNVLDATLLYSVLAGPDKADATTVLDNPCELPEWHSKRETMELKGLKFCVPEFVMKDTKDAIIDLGFEKIIEMLKAQGATVDVVKLDALEYGIETYHILANGEISANMSRFDGLRYGYRTEDYLTIDEMYIKSRSEGFGEEVKRRIMVGAYILSLDMVEDYFVKAQKVRKLIINSFVNAFNEYDAVIMPTSPELPFSIESERKPVDIYLSDRYTVPASLAGIPAISIPVKNNDDVFGLQIMMSYGEDNRLLHLSYSLEEVFNSGL
ncbi:MAG: Asp-tRNA(Asn)/Glu-tRNA(Gln) amidotransferase subunit GatA [Tissierellia bacterium]|nr:Asp-tRNA(Asn)/Glu-tRNA(Gln) amidotransferase subunit GatA [Tissierellia bacterium]